MVECLKVVTQEKSKRIAKFAFDYATRNGRKKVWLILSELPEHGLKVGPAVAVDSPPPPPHTIK